MNYAYSKRQGVLSNHFERVTKFIAGTADRTCSESDPSGGIILLIARSGTGGLLLEALSCGSEESGNVSLPDADPETL